MPYTANRLRKLPGESHTRQLTQPVRRSVSHRLGCRPRCTLRQYQRGHDTRPLLRWKGRSWPTASAAGPRSASATRTTPSTASTPSTKTHPEAARLPFSLKILLENLLRTEDGLAVRAEDIEALANWDPKAEAGQGDRLHAGPRAAAGLHRRARRRRSGRHARRHEDAWAAIRSKINPLQPAELVIDHSVQVDDFGNGLRLPHQRRPGVPAQPRALRLPALGPEGVPQLQGRAAGHRHRPPGQPRIPGPRRLHRRTASRSRWPIPTRWSAPIRTRR